MVGDKNLKRWLETKSISCTYIYFKISRILKMASLEEELKSKFANERVKAHLNVLFTANYLANIWHTVPGQS